jgi:hypothetical protein
MNEESSRTKENGSGFVQPERRKTGFAVCADWRSVSRSPVGRERSVRPVGRSEPRQFALSAASLAVHGRYHERPYPQLGGRGGDSLGLVVGSLEGGGNKIFRCKLAKCRAFALPIKWTPAFSGINQWQAKQPPIYSGFPGGTICSDH